MVGVSRQRRSLFGSVAAGSFGQQVYVGEEDFVKEMHNSSRKVRTVLTIARKFLYSAKGRTC